MENATCDVMVRASALFWCSDYYEVVKKEPFPSEIHEGSAAEARSAEEMERRRRMTDPAQGSVASAARELAQKVPPILEESD